MYANDPRHCQCGAPLLPVHDCDQRGAKGRGPAYYRQGGMQPWDVIDAFGLDYYRATAVKYLLRAGRKGEALEDLEKALHFIERAVEIEKEKDE